MDTQLSRKGEHGNVLFLILIAVILFAALSYAVTGTVRGQDERSDGSTIIAAAELQQYPTSLRTVTMMMRLDGIDTADMEFNPPTDFASLSSNSVGVFHPAGGHAPYQMASPEIMAGGVQGQWHFNAEFEIEYIGLGIATDFAGNDIVAFLPGVKQSVCSKVNDKIGISPAIPNSSTDLSAAYTTNMDDSYSLPASETILGIAGGNGTDILSGQPMGCFQNNGGDYVYYQVLLER